MSRRTSLTLVFVGALLLFGTPLAWNLLQPPEQVGQVPTSPSDLHAAADADRSESGQPDAGSPDGAARPPTTGRDDAGGDRDRYRLLAGDPGATAAAPRTDGTDGARDASQGGTGADTSRDGEHADPDTATTSGISLRGAIDTAIRPDRISIPRIDVDSASVPVGLEPDGTMEIPRDVATIGWYARGVVPGEPGSAVVTGHVDSRSQGPGAFFGLSTLDVDDRVVLTSADGVDQEWRVVARERRDRADIPREVVYARSGSPQLVLITCGGAFDRTARSYAENVIVYAEPVDGS